MYSSTDIKKLLRIALEVEMSDKALGDVKKVFTSEDSNEPTMLKN